MKEAKPIKSLESYFRSQTVRWSALGFLLTLLLSVPCIWYFSKSSSEKQISVLAKSAARAFRPIILQGNVRDAQFQMQRALELNTEESAIVLNSNFQPLYPMNSDDQSTGCRQARTYCWSGKRLSFIYPIYFDDVRQESLFGYLQLTTKPSFDMNVVVVFIVFLTLTFLGLAIGLFATLRASAREVRKTLSVWSNHLKVDSHSKFHTEAAPFSELTSMQEAVSGLQDQIEKLTAKTAQKAKADAQISLFREISHDLKTPHALLAKYFYLHLNTLETTGQADPQEIRNIETTIKRMGELLRQVRSIPVDSATQDADHAACDLRFETQTIVEDLRRLPEIAEKSILIEFNEAQHTEISARISKLGYYRILENLVRNAADAVASGTGKVFVSLSEESDRACLTVKDDGDGIAPEIQDQIFNFDFTTKLSRGTGLGLGIVNNICKAVGAKVSFQSKLNQGTQFKVSFETARMGLPNFAEVSHGQV